MKSLTPSRTAATLLLAAMIPVTTVSAQDKGVAPPTELWAAQTDLNTIALVWQGVSGAAQYLVFGPKSKKGDAGAEIQQLATLGRNATRFVAPVVGPGLLHQFSIQAVDAKGQASNKVQFNPVIPEAKQASAKTVPPPSSVTARETKPGEIRIIWSAVPGATAYLLSRSVAPGGFGTLCSLCPTETNYADKRVTAGAKHIYTVAAITPFGTSRKTWSNEVTPRGGRAAGNAETEDTQGPPKGVTDAKASLKSPTSVELTWGGGDGATTIRIFRVIAGTAEQIVTLPGNATRFADTFVRGLAGELSYEIQAVNAKGSSEKATVRLAAEPPKGATNPKASLKSPTSVELTWGGGVGATSIQIYRTLGTGKEELIATLGGNVSRFHDHFAGGFGSGVSYGIQAVNAKGTSEKARVAIAAEKAATDSAVSTPSPKAPTGLKANVISPTGIRLTWIAGLAGGMYHLQRQVGSGPAQVIGTFPGTVSNFLDHFPPGAMPGLISYWIEAVDGKSAASEKVTVATSKRAADSLPDPAATPPSPPSELKAAVTGPNTVTLTWSGPPNASYQISRAIGGGVIKAIGQTIAGVFRFIDQQLPPPDGKSHSIVYTVVALVRGATGGPVSTSKQASVTVTIDPQKGAAPPPLPGAAPADSAPAEGNLDSLPRLRGRP